MENMKTEQEYCPSCGAPIVSEICAYCGTPTEFYTDEVDMEYPVLECKEATVSFWTLWFPMIFAVSFGTTGLVMLLISALGNGPSMMLLIGIPFSLIGIAAVCFVLRTVLRYIKVKTRGKMIRGTVYGYMNDKVWINGRPAQIVKLLVHTPHGPRFILYQLGNTLRPYRIHERIEILTYQNYFLISKKKETIHW